MGEWAEDEWLSREKIGISRWDLGGKEAKMGASNWTTKLRSTVGKADAAEHPPMSS